MVLSVTDPDPAAIMHEHTALVFGEEKIYTCINDTQTYTVPAGVSFIGVVAFGPRGNDLGGDFVPPPGGVSAGVLAVTPGQLLYVMVGGVGAMSENSTDRPDPGWNGGGQCQEYGATGSGATDIRTDVADLQTRLVVAGGAGGSPRHSSIPHVGGIGGGENGGDACGTPGHFFDLGYGGGQTHGGLRSPGSFGQGGANPGYENLAGGGGGWYGGSFDSGTTACLGANGGSGHIASSVINGTMTAGHNPYEGLMYIVALYTRVDQAVMHEHTTLRFGEEKTYTCINDTQTYTVPEGVSFIGVVAFGPRGSDAVNGFVPSSGGISAGVLAVTPGQLFQVMVGGVGSTVPFGSFDVPAVGWNGGGSGGRGGTGGVVQQTSGQMLLTCTPD